MVEVARVEEESDLVFPWEDVMLVEVVETVLATVDILGEEDGEADGGSEIV